MSLWPMNPGSSSRHRTSRRALGLGLFAILAMVMAGPAHLWLAHGTGEKSESGTEVVLSTGGCHGHHCCGHGHGHGPIESSPDSSPDDPADDSEGEPNHGCDTCVLVASSTPLNTSVPPLPSGVELFAVVDTSDWSEPGLSEALVSVARGPPRAA